MDDKTPEVFSLEDDEDGLYECYFEFEDVNGNSTRSEKTYYVLKDNTGPSGTGKMKFASGKNSVSVTDYFASEEVVSIDSVTYTNKTQSGIDQKITKTFGNAGNSFEITDLRNTSFSVYELDVKATDIFGNSGTSTVTVITQPDAPDVKITPDNFTNTDDLSLIKDFLYVQGVRQGYYSYGHTTILDNVLPQDYKDDSYFVLYDSNNTCVFEGEKNSGKITIPTTSTGNKKYNLKIVIEYNGSKIEGAPKGFDYKETGADLLFVRYGYEAKLAQINLVFGYKNPQNDFSGTFWLRDDGNRGKIVSLENKKSTDSYIYQTDFCKVKATFDYRLYNNEDNVIGEFKFNKMKTVTGDTPDREEVLKGTDLKFLWYRFLGNPSYSPSW